jgi:ATP-dependent DNA helicase RecQ
MCYGLQDVVNQRRMIDESPADEEFKQGLRGKLDALLGLAERPTAAGCACWPILGRPACPAAIATTACIPHRCGTAPMPHANCSAPSTACSKPSGASFGAVHIMDILRGKSTEKVIAAQA